MEGCGLLYEEWRVGRCWSRLGRMVIVFILLCVVILEICGSESPVYPGAAKKNVSGTGGLRTEENESTVLFGVAQRKEWEKSEEFSVAEPPVPVSEEVSDLGSEMKATDMSDDLISEGEDAVIFAEPDDPAPTVPEAEAPMMPGDTVASVPEEEIPAAPEEELPEEEVPDLTFPVTVEGFLVDESGFICGIADPAEAVWDGYMELPAEGCTGIAAGAFVEAPAGTMEMYIPSNITYIEEGAFIGLPDMEWFEMEPSGNYYTKNGVLFSDGGTCILGFPAGRVGNYKVPSQVTRFAVDAFTDARISVVDAAECALTDTGNFPASIQLVSEMEVTPGA